MLEVCLAQLPTNVDALLYGDRYAPILVVEHADAGRAATRCQTTDLTRKGGRRSHEGIAMGT